MADLAEGAGSQAAHPLGRGVRRHQIRVGLFQRPQLPEQAVVLRIGHGGFIEHVVAVVVLVDKIAQFFDAQGRIGLYGHDVLWHRGGTGPVIVAGMTGEIAPGPQRAGGHGRVDPPGWNSAAMAHALALEFGDTLAVMLYGLGGEHAAVLILEVASQLLPDLACGGNRSEERRVGKEWRSRWWACSV